MANMNSSISWLPSFFSLTCLLLINRSVLKVDAVAVAMNTTHLSVGSADPPEVPGKIRIYSMRFCPFSQRAILVLLAKNIPFDPVLINLKAKPEWYNVKIPTGKAPALLVDGESVYESLIIADFLDEKYPERPLHSKNPLQKAKDRILIEGFGKVISPFYKVMTGANASLEEFEVVQKELSTYDKELSTRGTLFFGGDKPNMLDYMIWPWFERLEMFKVLYGDKFILSEERLPKLATWITAMKADDAVKEYYLTPEIHAKFMKTHQAGTPDYDILTHE